MIVCFIKGVLSFVKSIVIKTLYADTHQQDWMWRKSKFRKPCFPRKQQQALLSHFQKCTGSSPVFKGQPSSTDSTCDPSASWASYLDMDQTRFSARPPQGGTLSWLSGETQYTCLSPTGGRLKQLDLWPWENPPTLGIPSYQNSNCHHKRCPKASSPVCSECLCSETQGSI